MARKMVELGQSEALVDDGRALSTSTTRPTITRRPKDHQKDRKLSEIIVHQRTLEVAPFWCHMIQPKRAAHIGAQNMDTDHNGDRRRRAHDKSFAHQRLDRTATLPLKSMDESHYSSNIRIMSALRIGELSLGKCWPKESSNLTTTTTKKKQTKIAKATIMAALSIHIFILLLFANINFTVINCEQTIIQLRLPMVAQQLLDDGAWIETKRLNHRQMSAAAAQGEPTVAANYDEGATATTTNRRMDEDEDGDSDDDDEENEANETAAYMNGGAQLSLRRGRRFHDDVDLSNKGSSLILEAVNANNDDRNHDGKQPPARDLPFKVKRDANDLNISNANGPAAAAASSGAALQAADPVSKPSYNTGDQPDIENQVGVNRQASKTAGQQLSATGLDPSQANEKEEEAAGKEEANAKVSQFVRQVNRKSITPEPRSESHWFDGPPPDGRRVEQQQVANTNRNRDASLKAEAKLKATMVQLHFNKTLALDRKQTSDSMINDESNLLPNEPNEAGSVYAHLTPLVDKRPPPVISVSATRAPTHWVEYQPSDKKRHYHDLQVAADNSHQQRRLANSARSSSNTKFELLGDDDQWGRRKSAVAAGSEGPAKSWTSTTPVVELDPGNLMPVQLNPQQKQQDNRFARIRESNMTQGSTHNDELINWTPAARPTVYRASPISFNQPTIGHNSSNDNYTSSDLYNNQTDSFMGQKQPGMPQNQPDNGSILAKGISQINQAPTRTRSEAMGTDPSESFTRGWQQVAPPMSTHQMSKEPEPGNRWPLTPKPAESVGNSIRGGTPARITQTLRTSNSTNTNDDNDDNEPDDEDGSEALQAGISTNNPDPSIKSQLQDHSTRDINGLNDRRSSSSLGKFNAQVTPVAQPSKSPPSRQSDWPISAELSEGSRMEVPEIRPSAAIGSQRTVDNTQLWSPTTNQNQISNNYLESKDSSDKFRANRHLTTGFGSKSQRPGANSIPAPVIKSSAISMIKPQTPTVSPTAVLRPLPDRSTQAGQHLPAPIIKGIGSNGGNLNDESLMNQQQLLHPFGVQQSQSSYAALDAGQKRFQPPPGPLRNQQQVAGTRGTQSFMKQSFSAPMVQGGLLIQPSNRPSVQGTGPSFGAPELIESSQRHPSDFNRPTREQVGHQQNSNTTLSISTFPYPEPATDALSFFSVYPNKSPLSQQQHVGGHRFSSPVDEHSQVFGLGPKDWRSALKPISVDERKSQQDSPRKPSNLESKHANRLNAESKTQAESTQISTKPSDQKDFTRDSNPNGYLTINLRTHAAIGPNQLFWEAAAREVAQSAHHHLPEVRGRMPVVTNGHLLASHRELPSASSVAGAILRRPMRYVMGSQDDMMDISRTNGHAYPGMPITTKRSPALEFGSMASAPARFGDFVHLHGHHQAGGEFSYLESAPPHGFYPIAMPASLSGGPPITAPNFMAAAAAVPVSAFVQPPTNQQSANLRAGEQQPPSTLTSHHQLQNQDNQFLKKGQSIISAALPLATPAAVSDPFGWPMGYGSDAAKSLLKVNHVAPPPAYLIPAKVAAAQSSAYLYPTLIDLKQGSSTAIKEDSNTIIGHDQMQSDASDPIDDITDHWSANTRLLGQHSVLRPQIWAAPALVRKPARHSALTSVSQKVNQAQLKLTTRPPVVKRLSLWRRLRLLRKNRSSNSKNADSDPESSMMETNGNITANDTKASPSTRRFDLLSLKRRKRSLRESVSNFVSNLRRNVAQAGGRLYGSSQHVKKDPIMQSGSGNNASKASPPGQNNDYQTNDNRHRSRTSYIPLVDNTEQIIANLESDLLAQALLLSDQPPPRNHSPMSGKVISYPSKVSVPDRGHSHHHQQQDDAMMDTASMLVASHTSLNQQPSPGVLRLHNGEFRPLNVADDGPTAGSHLDPQLYTSLEPEAELEPPANRPLPNSSRDRFVQLSKSFIKSSRSPLNKLMKITSLGTAKQQNNSTGGSTKSNNTKQKQQTMGSMVSSSQQSISVAHQLGAVVSPAVMMSDNSPAGSLDNFNRFAMPLQQWFHQQQNHQQLMNRNKHHQPSASISEPMRLPLSYLHQQQLLPLVSHASIQLSPYSLITDNTQIPLHYRPNLLASRLRADVKANNDTQASGSNQDRGIAIQSHFLSRLPDGLLLHGAAKNLLDLSKALKGQRVDSNLTSSIKKTPQTNSTVVQLYRARKSLAPLTRLTKAGLEQVHLVAERQKSRPSPRSAVLYQPTILLRHPRIVHPSSLRRISDHRFMASQSVQIPFISSNHYRPNQHPLNATTNLWPNGPLSPMSGRPLMGTTHESHHLRLANSIHKQQQLNLPTSKTMGGQFKNVFMGPPTAQHRELVNGINHGFSFRFPAMGGQQQQQNSAQDQMANSIALQRYNSQGQSRNQSQQQQVESEIYSAASNQHQVELSGAEMEASVKLDGAHQHQHQSTQATGGTLEATPMDEASFNSLMATATNVQDDLQSLLPGGGYQQEMHDGAGKEIGSPTGPIMSEGVSDFSIEQQQQYQQQLLNQQKQQMMYQPDLGNGITMARPRLPKIIPSINSMASKFRQHLFQTFKLNPVRWPMLGSASSFISYPKFQPSNFLGPTAASTPSAQLHQIPLPQQQQLRLQAVQQQQQHLQHQQKLQQQSKPQEPQLLPPRPHNPISANYYPFGGPPIDSLVNKPNGIHFEQQQQQQQQQKQKPQHQHQQSQQVAGHQFSVSPLQYQQAQLLNRGQFKLNLNGRPSLTASEQAAIQMDGQMPNMMTTSGDGQQMVEDSQIIYTDKMPGMVGEHATNQQQQHHHPQHHPHLRVPMGDIVSAGQTMVEFVPNSMGGVTGNSSSAEDLHSANGAIDLYDQEMMVDPNSIVSGHEESVASQLANGQELIVPGGNQNGEQHQQQHHPNHSGGASNLSPPHSVMTDVSSNLVTSDGTYIQEEPTSGQHKQGPRHQSMGELSTATHLSESKENQPDGGHEQGANVSTILHHHHHMIMPVSDESEENRKRVEQQQYQLEQVVAQQQLGAESQSPDSGDSAVRPGSQQIEYELEQQVSEANRPRLYNPHTKKVMNSRQKMRQRIVSNNSNLSQQPIAQKSRPGPRSKQQQVQLMNGGELGDLPQADYQIIKANQMDFPLQYLNGTSVDPALYQKNGRKLLANGAMQLVEQSKSETSNEEQQPQQQPQQPQQVYEFENQVVVSGGDQYYEPANNQSTDSDSVTMGSAVYAENSTDSQHQYSPSQQSAYGQQHLLQRQPSGPHLTNAKMSLGHYRSSTGSNQMQVAGNQSDGSVEYHFRPLSSQGEEPNSTTPANGEQIADESGLFHSSPYRYPNNSSRVHHLPQQHRTLYPFVSQRANQIIRLNGNNNSTALGQQEQTAVGSLSSSSQDQYVLVDQPVIVTGGNSAQLEQANQTVKEVIRHNGNNATILTEQPMVYVSIKPDKVILPIQHTDQLQQLQQVQLQLYLQHQQSKRRPVKGPKGAQAKLQWQQPLVNRATNQQHQNQAPKTVNSTQDSSYDNGTATSTEAQATIMANYTMPNELGRHQQKAAQIALKNIKNHNLKPTTMAPNVPMRESFTRPPKAKIRWQGMSGANKTAGLNGTLARNELTPSETIRTDQAWVINGMTHQTYASNHRLAPTEQQSDNGSQSPAPQASDGQIMNPAEFVTTSVNDSSTIMKLYQNHKHNFYSDSSGVQEARNSTKSDETNTAQTTTTTTLSPESQTSTVVSASTSATVESTTLPSTGDIAGTETTNSPNQVDSRVYSHFGLHSSAGRSKLESPTGTDGSQRGRFQTFRSSTSRLSNHKQSAAVPTTSPTTATSGTQRRDSRTGSTSFRLSSSSSSQTSTSQAPQLPQPGDGSAMPTPPMSTPAPEEMALNATTSPVASNPFPQPSERPTVFVSGVELGPSRQAVDSVSTVADGNQTASPNASSGGSSGTELPTLGNYTQPDRPSVKHQISESPEDAVSANKDNDAGQNIFGRDHIVSDVDESESDQLMRSAMRHGLSDEHDSIPHKRSPSVSFIVSGDSGLLMPDMGLPLIVSSDRDSSTREDMMNLIVASKHSSDK